MADQNGERKSNGQPPSNFPVPRQGRDLPTFLVEGQLATPEQVARAKELRATGR